MSYSMELTLVSFYIILNTLVCSYFDGTDFDLICRLNILFYVNHLLSLLHIIKYM